MDKFIAIDVGQGDAFYLERTWNGVTKKILVDGGSAEKGFIKQFKERIDSTYLDIMVCTHADADHINGLIGLLKSDVEIGEVWVPGVWKTRIGDLLNYPRLFISETRQELEQLNIESENELENFFITNENRDFKPIIKQQDLRKDLLYPLRGVLGDDPITEAINNSKTSFYKEIIKTAKGIYDLVDLAIQRGISIRWFEYSATQNAGGGEAYLLPVNSKEITNSAKQMSALKMLCLSRANKESLVFYSPSTNRMSDVLFSADSDFSFQSDFPDIGDRSIITAPHHGSASNDKAYVVLRNKSILNTNSIIVRSDCEAKTRPSKGYLDIDSNKICTTCRALDNPPTFERRKKQSILFESSSTGWKLNTKNIWCDCT